jgi:hypothetical protein
MILTFAQRMFLILHGLIQTNTDLLRALRRIFELLYQATVSHTAYLFRTHPRTFFLLSAVENKE